MQLWCVAWVGTALLGRQRRVASIVLARLCLVPCVGRSALHLADACEGVAKIIQLSVDPQSVRGMILRVWPVLLQLVCFAIVVALARRSFATGLPLGWHWLVWRDASVGFGGLSVLCVGWRFEAAHWGGFGSFFVLGGLGHDWAGLVHCASLGALRRRFGAALVHSACWVA